MMAHQLFFFYKTIEHVNINQACCEHLLLWFGVCVCRKQETRLEIGKQETSLSFLFFCSYI